MTSTSPVGDLVGLKEGELLIPVFIRKRPEGVFIDVSVIPAEGGLQTFIERLFTNGAYFKNLNYTGFMRLLFGAGTAADGAAEVRIADDIIRFSPQRRVLYKGVKIIKDGERAEYVFEPVFLESVVEEPVYGDPGDDGVKPIVGHTQKTEMQPTRLDFDEFVADMWLKGVRFGLDTDAVRQAIERGDTIRMDIAFQRAPTNGMDAEIREETTALHRDNSPRIMLNGKADLRSFKNRFPQIAKDVPLLRKIPRVLGEPGYRVTGQIIEPPLPLDFDLNALAGPGTRIERSGKGELIVANMDGFIAFDTRSNHIEVTKKVENRGGVSVRTTGDISLAVDDFVEHGEVQEGRVVEGKHMTFRADVFGAVMAQNGNIQLDKNLSGGCARSVGGDIAVKGRAFNAILEAWDGKITAVFAESCMIFGKTVSIEHAVNCEIIAESLHLKNAEGCAIAGEAVQIGCSNDRKDKETVVSMLVPDFSVFDQQIARIKNDLLEIGKALDARAQEITAASSEPGFAKYLSIMAMIQAGTIRLTAEQRMSWQQMANRYATAAKALAVLNAGEMKLEEKGQALEQEIERVSRQRKDSGAGVRCEIKEVLGETVVQKLRSGSGLSIFHNLPGHELRAKLRHLGGPQERIFSGSQGCVEWQFTAAPN